MAEKITTELVCDVTGEPDAEQVWFGLDGVNYEIDLSSEHAFDLRTYLSKYIASARRVSGNKVRKGARPVLSATQPDRPAYVRKPANPEGPAIRAWAAENGYNLGTRGAIPKSVKAEYEEAKQRPVKEAPARKPTRKKAAAK
ncbi:nucleoid-associated protein Lsr2 [Amycolatopsis sp. WAC 01376]|uniref:histone-like nucleoid-structuring protein Lsr2 n=1 Tax=Amycolatopsis sp. WAC 01376 TaxID=2203195 RepID=UPI000F77FA35|nr:Lsr2 family protein [Amycolatopsis sp. WAC 01376]RSM66606.1 nucleoid-associated protein Lsr2 [Amycolatopsis sp. WAC 01376]